MKLWKTDCGNIVPVFYEEDIPLHVKYSEGFGEGGGGGTGGGGSGGGTEPIVGGGGSGERPDSCYDDEVVYEWDGHAYRADMGRSSQDASWDHYFSHPENVSQTVEQALEKYPGYSDTSVVSPKSAIYKQFYLNGVTLYRDCWTYTVRIWHPCT
jgi:hypothetical protein